MPVNRSITPDIEDRLYELIKAGNYPSVACQAVGISSAVYGAWLRRGEFRDREGKPTPEQIRFAQRMREAEALAETEMVGKIIQQADKNPDIGLKFLARRFKNRWGESREINVNWTVRALEAIKAGDLQIEDLEAELGPELTSKVRAQLEAPQTLDGEWSEVSESAHAE